MLKLVKANIFLTILAVFLLLPEAHAQASQATAMSFHHLSVKDGLPHNQVLGMVQDNSGFMWFATRDGLCRYDGFRFRVFNNNKNETNSLSNNYIKAIIKDTDGSLWLATMEGLNKFDPQWELFTRFVYNRDNPETLSNNEIEALCIDSRNNLWVGTENGLNRLDINTEKIVRFMSVPGDAETLSDNEIETIFEDHSGFIWVGTEGGLNRFNPASGKFKRFLPDSSDPKSISHDKIETVFEDRDGILWIGTDGGGINRFDPQSETFSSFRHSPLNNCSIASDEVSVIYEDKTGNLWVGLNDSGLELLDKKTGRFSHYKHIPNDPRSLSFNEIKYIYEDNTANLWVCTKGGGVNRYLKSRSRFTHSSDSPFSRDGLTAPWVYTVFQENPQTLWVGTDGGGVDIFNSETGNVKHLTHSPGARDSLSSNRIWCILKDKTGTVWLGTKDNGLNAYHPDSGKTEQYKADPETPGALKSKSVISLHEDKSGDIWVGTYEGLHRLNRKTGIFERFTHNPGEQKNIKNRINVIKDEISGKFWVGTDKGLSLFNPISGGFSQVKPVDTEHTLLTGRIHTILVTSPETIWVGTNGGLNRFNPSNGSTTLFTVKDGLPGNTVYGILKENNNQLWLSTGNGIARFNPATNTFRNYGIENGIKDLEFYQGASHKGPDGEFFFGGKNGFIRFFPGSFSANEKPPNVMLTDFKIFEKNVETDLPLSALEQIRLSYKDSFFSLEFAALDFAAPLKNQYAYKLEGFDRDWVYSGNRRYAIYTNLDGGNYRFRVRASNNDGVWNNDAFAIKIKVTPPIWKTWWAYTLYLFIVSAAVIFYARYKTQKHTQQLNKKLGELAREKRLAESLDTMVKDRTRALQDSNEQIRRKNHIFRSFLKTFAIMNQTLKLDEFLEQTLVQLKNLFPNWDFGLIIEGKRPEIIKSAVFRNFSRQTQGQLLTNNRYLLDKDNAKYLPNAETMNWIIMPLTGRRQQSFGKIIVRGDDFTEFSREVISIFMEQINAVTENKILTDELERIANTDSLTKAFNRSYFDREYQKFMNQNKKFNEMHFAIVMMDINGLKRINDIFGHEKGDEMIIIASRMIMDVCRASDIPVRLGGDELLILCPSTKYEGALIMKERIFNQEDKYRLECQHPDGKVETIPVHLSIGVAASDTTPAENVLKRSDEQMYKEKEAYYKTRERHR